VSDGNADVEWGERIAETSAARTVRVTARRFDGGLTTASRPQKFYCEGGPTGDDLYLVKFAQNQHGDGRAIFTEQIVARAGRLIEAPVAAVELIDVSAGLADEARIQAEPELGFVPEEGVHHGSLWAFNHSERQAVDHVDSNRGRFAALDVLYAWIPCGGDHQFIYDNTEPRHVLSVDHTPFFPNGPDWTAGGLVAATPNVQRDQVLAALPLAPDDHANAVNRLLDTTEADIAAVVAAPPDDWGVGTADREAIASYLWSRRETVAQLFNVEER
jgi:hypothetical protein